VANDGNIPSVEGGVDFVHHVEWGGFEVMQAEHKGQGGQGFFSATETVDLRPGLVSWSDTAQRKFMKNYSGAKI